jgi:peptide/nickel transport system substrate-binding protein
MAFHHDDQSVRRLAAAALFLALPVAAAAEPVRGGTLNSALWPEPPGIVIGLHLNAPTLLPSTKIFEGLMTYDFDLNPLPVLAESWEISDDGLVWTMNLREGVAWHDGEPFTADDVVFTFSEFIPEVHARSRPTFQRAEVAALDDLTVQLTLEEPYAPFLRTFDAIGAPIVPAHIYRGTDFRTNPANQAPIGTGPFKFEEWRTGEYIHLVRNDDYWQEGKPYLDEIYYRFIPDSASRALALETGQIQLATQSDIELVDVARLDALPHLDVTTRGWEWGSPIAWMEVNIRREPFDNADFRRAILHAIDREFIAENIFFGLAEVATSPIHSSSPFYEPDVPRYAYDPEKARAILDAAGFEPDADGTRAEVALMGLPYGELWDRVSQYIRQSLDQVGIRVTLEATDVAGWGSRFGNWDYDMTTTFLTTLSDPALGVARTFITENQRQGVLFTNTSGYSNPEVDELFAKAAASVDEEERKQLYSEVQKIIVDEAALIWLVELQWPTIHDTRLQNVVQDGLGPNSSFADVYFGE